MSIKKMTLMLPTLFLIACGGYQTQPANNIVNQLSDEGHLSDDDMNDFNALPDEVKQQDLVVSETIQDDGTVILAAGNATAKVTYMNDAHYAMKINDILVPHSVAQDKASLEGLIMGILGQQLGKIIDIIPGNIQSIIEAGLGLINAGTFEEGLESVLRLVIKGFYNMFISTIPFGNVIAPILDTILDGVLGDDSSTTPGDSAGDTNDEPENTIADGILDFISGLF